MEMLENQPSADQIFAAIEQLPLPEIERLTDRVLALKAARRAPHLNADETSLLQRINQGLPDELRKRLNTLREKREASSINDPEYEELTHLTDQAEELQAERLAAMAELASLRGISLTALMDQLSIHFPENV